MRRIIQQREVEVELQGQERKVEGGGEAEAVVEQHNPLQPRNVTLPHLRNQLEKANKEEGEEGEEEEEEGGGHLHLGK